MIRIAGAILSIAASSFGQASIEIEAEFDSRLSSEAITVADDLVREKIMTPALSTVPEFYRVKDADFRRLAESRQASHRNRECCFDSKLNAIFVPRRTRLGANLAMKGDQIEPLRRVAIAHQLAHAWQLEHAIRKPSEHVRVDNLVFLAILEGHAQWVAGRYANKLGVGKVVEQASGLAEKLEDAQTKFMYHDGRKFWEARVAANPAIQVKDVLIDPKVSQRTIAYPEASPTDLQGPPPSLCKLLANCSQANSANTNFTDFRDMVEHLRGIDDPGRVCRSYEVSWSVADELQSAALARLESDQAASSLFLGWQQLHRKENPVVQGDAETPDISWCAYSRPKFESDHAVHTAMIRDGVFIVQINDQRASSTAQELRTWLEAVIIRYREARPAIMRESVKF